MYMLYMYVYVGIGGCKYICVYMYRYFNVRQLSLRLFFPPRVRFQLADM